MRLYWPGRGPTTQHTLAELRDDLEVAGEERPGQQVSSMEVRMVHDFGGRFAQSRNFIRDLEEAVPTFYDVVVQRIRAWQAPAPRIREDRMDAAEGSPPDRETGPASSIENQVEPSEPN